MQACFSGKLVDAASKFALEVGCFVLGYGLFSSQMVKHGRYFDESFSCLSFIGEFAKIAHGITGSLGIVAVAKTT